MHDLPGHIKVVILLRAQTNGEIGIAAVKVLVVHTAGEVGNFHPPLVFIEDEPIENGGQEHHNGNNCHHAARHHRNGRRAAALGIPAGFLLPPLSGASQRLRVPPGLAAHPSGLADRHGTGLAAPSIALNPALGLRHSLCRCFRLGGDGGDYLGGIPDRNVIIEGQRRILPKFLQIAQQLRRAGIAVFGLQCHGLHDDLLHPHRNVGIQGGGAGRAAIDMLNGNRHRGVAVIGWAAGHHLKHYNAQRIDIRAAVGKAALGLLRGDVMNGAKGFFCQGVALVHHLGNAKVHHLDGAVFQHHDVVGLDVPVDNAPAVGVFQSFGNLGCKVEGFLPVEDALYLHILFEGDAINQLHNDVIGILRSGNVKHLHDVWVAEHGHGLALCPEAAEEIFIRGKLVFEHLYSHQAVKPMAACFIHHRHAARADDLQKLITAIQQLSNILIHTLK